MTDIRAALRLHGGSEAKCCKRTILTTFHLIQMQQRGNVLRFLHDKQIDARKTLGRFFFMQNSGGCCRKSEAVDLLPSWLSW